MQRSTDLTTGPIAKKLLKIAVPIMGTQLMQMTYNLADMFWLGRIENPSAAVAASGIGGMFMWLSMALMMFGRMGAEIGVSQNLGRGDRKEANAYARAAIQLALLLGIGFGGILGLFPEWLIAPFGMDEAAVNEAAIVYLRIAAIGIPFTYISAAITGVFNGAGNSTLSFICNAVGLVVNMILDPLMITGLGWGVAGAAIATVIGQGSVCALFLVFLKRHPKRPLPELKLLEKTARHVQRQIIKWSWPIALESGLFTLLAMVVTKMVAEYGTSAITVQRIGSQIESLSWLIGGGFGTAVTAFIGQNYGARKPERIRAGFRTSLLWLLVWQAMVMAVLLFLGEALYKVFINDETIQSMGVVYLRILSVCVMSGAFESACSGAFRGMGRTMPPSLCSIVTNIARPILCYVLAQRMGLNGLWWGITLSASMRGVTMGAWYFLTIRRSLEQIETAEPEVS